EDLRGAPDVDHAATLLATLRRPVAHLGTAAGDLEKGRGQLVHVRLASLADVHRPGAVALQREHAHAGDVADVAVVAGLLAAAVRRHGLAPQHAAAEDRHHAGLAVRVLARTVDVGIAEGDERQAVLGLEEVAVELAGTLAHTVGADGPGGMRLGCGEHLL